MKPALDNTYLTNNHDSRKNKIDYFQCSLSSEANTEIDWIVRRYDVPIRPFHHHRLPLTVPLRNLVYTYDFIFYWI